MRFVDEEILIKIYDPAKDESRLFKSYLEKNEINVILFPSIFPETFSYVTSEAMKMKMPIAYFDIGAVPEKLKSYKKGSLLGLNMAHEEIIDALNALNKRTYLKESYLT